MITPGVEQVNIKLLNGFAKIPSRGSAEAAGYDLYNASDQKITILPHCTVKIGTGIAIELPPGTFGGLVARSGLATKKNLRVCQGLAIVDSDYRGEVFVPIHNDSNNVREVEPGERIAQLVVLPYIPVDFNIVEKLNNTDRGAGGFGSSGSF